MKLYYHHKRPRHLALLPKTLEKQEKTHNDLYDISILHMFFISKKNVCNDSYDKITKTK